MAVGDMDGSGFADLAVSPDTGAPARIEVWAGAMLSTGVYPGNLSPIASFYAFAPSDLSGARLAMVDLSGNGQDDLVVASENAQNSAARVFAYSNFQTGNLNVATTYPLGTATISGLYAADHVAPNGTTSRQQCRAETTGRYDLHRDVRTDGLLSGRATNRRERHSCRSRFSFLVAGRMSDDRNRARGSTSVGRGQSPVEISRSARKKPRSSRTEHPEPNRPVGDRPNRKRKRNGPLGTTPNGPFRPSLRQYPADTIGVAMPIDNNARCVPKLEAAR